MKTEQLLLKLSKEELNRINAAFKQDLLKSEGVISRLEFIRILIREALDKREEI